MNDPIYLEHSPSPKNNSEWIWRGVAVVFAVAFGWYMLHDATPQQAVSRILLFAGLFLWSWGANVKVQSDKQWFTALLRSNWRATALLFGTCGWMSNSSSEKTSASYQQIFWLSFLVPASVCLTVWAFERIVKRPPFAPYHRAVIAVLMMVWLAFFVNVR